MKQFFLVIMLFAIAFSVVEADVIDAALAKKMAQNPKSKLHVIAFFKEKLEPQQVINDMGIRGEKSRVVQQVVEIYKNNSARQFFWFAKSCPHLQNLTVHELAQAASFKASVEEIKALANHHQISKMAVYDTKAAKPAEFFLTKEYFTLRPAEITYLGKSQVKPVSYKISREGSDIDWTKIINTLKKVYDFIKENQPVVDINVDQSSALPKGLTSWHEMAGWKEKHTGQYSITYKNLFNITVVKIVLRLHFYYDGNYKNVGHYITCATATIDDLTVRWGYTLNATAQIPDTGIVNVGTMEDPIAGMKIFIHWVVSTIVQHSEGSQTFAIDGKGNVDAH